MSAERVELALRYAGGGGPLRPQVCAQAVVRRFGAGPVRLTLATPVCELAWVHELNPPDARTGQVAACEFSLPGKLPSGPCRLIAATATGAHDVVRFEFEGTVPATAIWRHEQAFMARVGEQLQSLDLTVLAPKSIPFKLSVSPPPPVDAHSRHAPTANDDLFGNRWRHTRLNSSDLQTAGAVKARRARRIGGIQTDLVSFTVSACLPALARHLDPLRPLPRHLAGYLQPEPHIESDAPEVLELARDVPMVAEAGWLRTAHAAWVVTRRSLRYQIQRAEFGARYAAIHGVGDCTEYAALFTALCRARGLPARVAAGVYPDNPEPPHAVAEIWLHGLWLGLDVTNTNVFGLGLPASFVPLMRANWMSNDRAYLPYHYQFTTRLPDTPPQIKFRQTFTRTRQMAGNGTPPELGGDWLAPDRAKPGHTLNVSLNTTPTRWEVRLANPTPATWRVTVVGAVEPQAPIVFAVRELEIGPGRATSIEIPAPSQFPELRGCVGGFVGILSGDQWIDIRRAASTPTNT